MPRWVMEIRVVYHCDVVVEAASKAEARAKARRAAWEPDRSDERDHQITVVGTVRPEEDTQ